MDDNKIVITDNNGEENVFKILFTYEDEENGNKYVMYYSEEDDEQIFASRYDGDNIEDPAEWERLEEVLEDFNMHDEEETDDKCDGCVCEDGDCVTDCSECDKN
jgi:uncharacterized protein YrzB (UPF0473 family)